jgi:inosose dehydratase
MDEIAKAGYEGTELGPYGYYPTDAMLLRKELAQRNLRLASSFVPLPLEDPTQVDRMINQVVQIASLLTQFGVGEIIIADDSDPAREKIAGNVPKDGSMSWNEPEWQQVANTVNRVARTCQDRFGMRLVFHHHVGGYVETPAEVDRLMAMTDPALVGLCFDTGHYVYGGGDVLDAGRRYAQRIWYVHLKDVWFSKLQQVRQERIDMRRAWEMGVFAELGQGGIDFPGFIDLLRSSGYQGWMIVEQDVVKDADPGKSWSPLQSAIQSRTYLREILGL